MKFDREWNSLFHLFAIIVQTYGYVWTIGVEIVDSNGLHYLPKQMKLDDWKHKRNYDYLIAHLGLIYQYLYILIWGSSTTFQPQPKKSG